MTPDQSAALIAAGAVIEIEYGGWRSRAACRHADPDLFFPEGTNGPALAQLDEAKRICLSCPVRRQCLTWAVDHDISSGIWGGATPDERWAIRRAAGIPEEHRSAS